MTGWGAHVVRAFELLGWTQNVNHRRAAGRRSSGGSAAVRRPSAWASSTTLDLIDCGRSRARSTPSTCADAADDEGATGSARSLSSCGGSRRSRSSDATARRVRAGDPLRYTFSPLGGPHAAVRPEVGRGGSRAEDVGRPHRRRAERARARPAARLPRRTRRPVRRGPHSFVVRRREPADVVCKDLSDWKAAGFPRRRRESRSTCGSAGSSSARAPRGDPQVTLPLRLQRRRSAAGRTTRRRRLELGPGRRRSPVADPLDDRPGSALVVGVRRTPHVPGARSRPGRGVGAPRP